MPELGFGASGAVGVGGDEAADPSSPSGASHSAEEKSTGARPRSNSRPSSASSSSCDDMAWGGTHRFVEAGLGLISWSVLRQVCEPSRYCEPLAWCQHANSSNAATRKQIRFERRNYRILSAITKKWIRHHLLSSIQYTQLSWRATDFVRWPP